VIVSHSADVAKGTADMVRQMVGEEVPCAFCGGNPAGGLGTDPGQIQAAMAHDTWDELPSIAAPTLVVHGEADQLVPTPNGVCLAERIAGAELTLIPGAGHMLQSDALGVVRKAVLAFLARVGDGAPPA
jgi:pimeloyl-ACP methyl ester carboxylesterase